MIFESWPKTPRLFRDITISEKIDGTNACIIFEDDEELGVYKVGAQSRNRLIFPGWLSGTKDSDNAGFAQWVYANSEELFNLLGYGRHYGEWWGQGVARKYGMDHKVFSLFNADRWLKSQGDDGRSVSGANIQMGDAVINSVPVLYKGQFSESAVRVALQALQLTGSFASPGFMNPEGICVYHHMSKQVFKVTLDNEDKGKWELDG